MGEAEVLGMKLDTFGWTKAADASDTEMPWRLVPNCNPESAARSFN